MKPADDVKAQKADDAKAGGRERLRTQAADAVQAWGKAGQPAVAVLRIAGSPVGAINPGFRAWAAVERPLLTYFALAYFFSWLVFVPMVVLQLPAQWTILASFKMPVRSVRWSFTTSEPEAGGRSA